MTESTSLRSQITEYPVEDGSVISDHITQESETLSIEGVITSAGTLFNWTSGKSKLTEAKETLRQLHESKTLITVMTGVDVYTDFAIESCDISRSAEEGEKLLISLSLRKIKKVTLRREEIPPEKTSGKATGKAGKTKTNAGKAKTSSKVSATKATKAAKATQATSSASSATKSTSILRGMIK